MTHDKKTFIDAFNGIARHKHRYKVFEDFVTMSAISLHNAVNKNDVLEIDIDRTVALMCYAYRRGHIEGVRVEWH